MASSSERVFREGENGLELVGDFDGLYADEADPWQQSGTDSPMGGYYAAARSSLVAMIAGCEGDAVEVGCGHGHALVHLIENTYPRLKWRGVDISRKAIEQAKANYPGLVCWPWDIRKDVGRAGPYDLVLLNQLLWYILPDIDAVVANCVKMLRPGGTLVIAQAYLKGEQRFAAEIANGFAGVVDLFQTRFPHLRMVAARYDQNTPVHDDGILVFQC